MTAQDAPGPGTGSSSRPSAVDWTDRWNTSWLGTVKAQVGGDCYLYAAAGLVEAMTRIEHSVWATRSEDDAGDALSFLMGSYDKDAGGGPNDVLGWVKANGIADYGCWKGNGIDAVANPSPDRLGRTVKLDAWQWVPGADAMKDWLDANGPLAVCFNLYDGFGTKCSRTQVYVVGASETNIGRHCLQIVGYDDTKQAWLIRNSWGTGWGTGGYGWYG